MPVGGWGKPDRRDHARHRLLALPDGPHGQRYTRASTLEVTYADYVRMGRARGLSERRSLWKYVLRTSLIPLITIMGPWIPNILTGSIFIEATFALPGLGAYFTTASLHRDYPLIMALVLIVAVLWGVCYILSDIAYVIVDPRVRLEGAVTMTSAVTGSRRGAGQAPGERQLLARRLVPLPPQPPGPGRRRDRHAHPAGGDPGPLYRSLRRGRNRLDWPR